MSEKRTRVVVWGLMLLVVVGAFARMIVWGSGVGAGASVLEIIDLFGWVLIAPITFSSVAAVILSRQPDNRVGWLMMLIGLAMTNQAGTLVANWGAPPANLTVGSWFVIWIDSFSWLGLIIPILLIPLYFPSGTPPTPRWRWVSRIALLNAIALLAVGSFAATLEPSSATWTIDNPIGLIPMDFFVEGPFLVFFAAGLLVSVTGSIASLFVRYRRTTAGERQQIRWLLLAGATFMIVYIFGLVVYIFELVLPDSSGPFESPLLSLLLISAIMGFPIAIAFSILRYRLWDLDVAINRALIYGPLTTVLAGVFAMLIAVTTEVTKQTLGSQSQALGAAFGAVAVAVIFQPLRLSIQSAVDRRFYPQKLNLASGLVEVEPGYWPFLDPQRLVQLATDHIRAVLGTPHSAFYMLVEGQFQLVKHGFSSGPMPAHIALSESEWTELRQRRVIAAREAERLVAHVPVYIDRGDALQLLALLSIGARENGRGYSGDELKAMIELGGKIGLALNALQLRQQAGAQADMTPAFALGRTPVALLSR